MAHRSKFSKRKCKNCIYHSYMAGSYLNIIFIQPATIQSRLVYTVIALESFKTDAGKITTTAYFMKKVSP